MRYRSYLCAVLALVVLTSCSIQRRNYRSGFYIDWKNSTAQKEVTRKENKQSLVPRSSAVTEVFVDKNSSRENITASLNETEIIPVFTKTKTYIDNCDTIIFRDGTEVLAKVIEIGVTEIKYKNCDNQSGPTYVVDKNKVQFIVYSNGKVEQFKVEQQPSIANKYNENESSDRMALKMGRTSMIYGIIGMSSMIGYGIGGIIMGALALLKSKRAIEYMGRNRINDPKAVKYALLGKKFGFVALGVGIVILALIILILTL